MALSLEGLRILSATNSFAPRAGWPGNRGKEKQVLTPRVSPCQFAVFSSVPGRQTAPLGKGTAITSTFSSLHLLPVAGVSASILANPQGSE